MPTMKPFSWSSAGYKLDIHLRRCKKHTKTFCDFISALAVQESEYINSQKPIVGTTHFKGVVNLASEL